MKQFMTARYQVQLRLPL